MKHLKLFESFINEETPQGSIAPVEVFGEKGFEVKDSAITRTGKVVKKTGLGAQFCYAIPCDQMEAFKTRKNITQTEVTEAKKKGVSPWTDIQQYFRNNDMGQCQAKTEGDFATSIGKYVGLGHRGELVKTIQSKLCNAAEGYANEFMMTIKTNPSKDPIDGIFGKTTQNVVKQYQKENKIFPADGYVRQSTWNVLKNVAQTHKYDTKAQKWLPISGDVASMTSKKINQI
jgi:hypothetical protein